MRHALTLVGVLALAAACASPGLPPGGPTVSSFPRVIATLPDSNAVNVKPDKVLLRYDDVIGEQANGGELSRNVLISPWDGEPRVEWRRTGMTIRPRDRWRTNTAYTITVLPGIGDLRGTPSPFGYVLKFSTGATIPKTVLRGVAFDWAGNRALPKATVQAIDVRDTTLVYVTVSDSGGRFELGAMPPGRYLVRAIDERSPNRQLDAREPWDSATVTIADSARAELYVFVHDTIPARIAELRQNDSVTIAIVMDKPLRPGVPIPATSARVVAADSSAVPVASVATEAEDRVQRERADSIARTADTTARRPADELGLPRRTIDPTRRRDTVAVVPPAIPTRPPPTTELLIRLGAPLRAGTTYRVTLTGVRNLLDIEGTSTRLLIIPRAAASDSTARPGSPTARPPR
ncbi:MAG TPA: Ig-like domain-containing protein [Gemmatimonadaceae bacterium]|nr:Ig-like domain-containing protein [Gemmatimonadaceae bacterium]